MLTESYFIIKDLHKESLAKYHSIVMKKARIKKWLYFHKKILNLRNSLGFDDRIYYATFTFKNDKLNDNYIKKDSFFKYLRENHIRSYVLNKDYGDENERFHLHGFIYADCPLKNFNIDLYGFVKLIDCSTGKREEEEEEKIINYITNYVIKNNFFSSRVFTSYFEMNIMR